MLRPLLSLDEQIRSAAAIGWSGEESDMLVVELRGNGSGISSVDQRCVVTTSGRRIDLARLEDYFLVLYP